MSHSLYICLSSYQGHGPCPISRLWQPYALYGEGGDDCAYVWVGHRDRRRGWSSGVEMSAPERTAGGRPLLPRRPLTPMETVPRQVAAGSLWKHPRPCLSDWPYGPLCHPGIPPPHCANVELWETRGGSLAISTEKRNTDVWSAVYHS